ncbi:MAG TPA: protein-L-isoaspartate O-methyltransferase [Xanthobacteraceae bacterium]|nr:protein-L-isoaspartate O-methyltransferase [Xanthobacteraceae bacterium]
MIDFSKARRMMVDGQIRPNDVTDLRIIGAMLDVPRERFVPPESVEISYLDLDISVSSIAGGGRRRMLKPMMLAKLIQAAEIQEHDAVLDIGCTTGYSTAILARLAHSVIALEEDGSLASRARQLLADMGEKNVSVVTGPLMAGWAPHSPYDVIVLEGATEVEPRTLFPQLKEGGRLVCVRSGTAAGKAMLYRRAGGEVSGWPIFDANAPVLPGFIAAPAFVF